MDPNECKRIAKIRQDSHPNGTARRDNNDPTKENRIGVTGEAAFAESYPKLNLKVDDQPRPQGDLGIDFIIDGTVIDVKTRATVDAPYLMFLKASDEKLTASVYVLGWYLSDGVGKVLGWISRSDAEEYPLSRTDEWGNPSRSIPTRRMRPMSSLLGWIKERRK